MIQTIRKAWGIPELRKKIVFTLLILLIFRVGNAIPTPYINTELLGAYIDSTGGSLLSLYNVMSGGAFAQATVFALGVQPYINSSIIIQLLTIAIPALERLARDGGEAGKKKIASITRYATVAIALLQAFGYYMICKNYGILEQSGIWPALVIIVTLVAGSSFVMWLGEQVNEFGIGNGISMILFAGIISRIPTLITGLFSEKWYVAILMVVGMLAIVMFIVFITNSERRIPVQYAKRVVGRKMYGGQSTNLPIKVNMSGVMPIIFAQALMFIPMLFQRIAPGFAAAFITSVKRAGTTALQVCMFVVAFSVLSAFLLCLLPEGLPPEVRALLVGMLELSNGVLLLGGCRAAFPIAAFLLGFSGLSVCAQAQSLLAPAGLGLGQYLPAKLLHGALSALLALLLSALHLLPEAAAAGAFPASLPLLPLILPGWLLLGIICLRFRKLSSGNSAQKRV